MNHTSKFTASLLTVLGMGCETAPLTPQQPDTVAQDLAPRDRVDPPPGIGGHTPRQILDLFGYKGVPTGRQAANYRRVFGFLDANRDGRHSKTEYIDNGVHMNARSRRGIFRASDSNRDGFVSRAEYVENRAITDEAKEIFYDMDSNRNNRLTADEIISSGRFKEEKLAKAVFKALDTNSNGELIIPEYLRVWGVWARSSRKPQDAPRK